ncbi:MAG TPA: hypothetical protein VKB86_10760 [Pyrinomonadaceae bacterium]|nr:hypothetical protein [Pyrinomonadaceae bacterium]
MSSEGNRTKQDVSQSSDKQSPLRACPACGAVARRVDARFCSSCGRRLDETYLPADALRASYNQRHRRVVSRSSIVRSSEKPMKSSIQSSLRPANRNGAAMTAMAFVTYALVPYLGILFCPGAVLMGGLGLYNSYRTPERVGRRASRFGIALGLLIFCAQLFLWWILYKIPQWRMDS